MSEPIRDLTYDELSALERLRASEQNRLEATVETWRARERQLLDALRLSEARVAELETTIRVNDDDFERQKAFLQEALEDEHAQLAVAVARCDELREAARAFVRETPTTHPLIRWWSAAIRVDAPAAVRYDEARARLERLASFDASVPEGKDA